MEQDLKLVFPLKINKENNKFIMRRNEKKRILVVDDSQNTLELIRRVLSLKGYQVITGSSVVNAISILEQMTIDLVITDLKMPNINGIELVRHVKENYKNTGILVITGFPSIKGAVETVKLGADEYMLKTFTHEELYNAVKNALEKIDNRQISNEISKDKTFISTGLIGKSEVMQNIYNEINKASKLKATILLTGETGTGKELVARAIHYNSPQATAPFIPVNCGGIPEGLLESELFGYVKGAFTGATETRGGFFQAADGGTLFLDEISNTSISMQVKLLRVLQEKEVYMIGSNKSQKINLRIIAATNVNLSELVKKSTFREDLFYRLNVIPINIPPLRQRGEDILLLINHFKIKYAKEIKKKTPEFSDNVLKIFKNYYWSGNVRELENIIQRLVMMTDSDLIDIPDLPPIMRYSAMVKNGINRTLIEVEKEHIINVISLVKGNKTKAAEILGIDRKTLREKLKKYNYNIN